HAGHLGRVRVVGGGDDLEAVDGVGHPALQLGAAAQEVPPLAAQVVGQRAGLVLVAGAVLGDEGDRVLATGGGAQVGDEEVVDVQAGRRDRRQLVGLLAALH